jgi:hypothetical protein
MSTTGSGAQFANIDSETQARIAAAVKQFDDGKISVQELEKIVGAVSLVGYLNKTPHPKLDKNDLNIFLSKANMI